MNTGLKGTFGQSTWNYEALIGYSQSRLEQKWPALVSAKAQALYLGPSLGIDPTAATTSTMRPSAVSTRR